LFLFTKEEIGWEWCLFEAGMFIGSKGNKDSHLICIKNFEINNLISPLENLQSYDSSKDGIKKFLIDLLEKGVFTEGEIINSKISGEDNEDLEAACTDISSQFSRKRISMDFIPKRLCIGPLPLSEDNKTRKLQGSKVTANIETQGLFDIDFNSDIYWEDLYEAFQIENQKTWVDEIESAVKKIKSKKKFPTLFTPFRALGNLMYYPLLTRVERIKKEPINLYISFVETKEESDETADVTNQTKEPLNHSILLDLLNMARYYRWNYLEWALEELNKENITEEQKEICYQRFAKTLMEVDERDQKDNFRNLEYVSAYFMEEAQENLRKQFEAYKEMKKEFIIALKEKNDKLLINAIEKWRELNKEFMVLTISTYLSYVKRLAPINQSSCD
jgi:hypothetical protein